MRFTADALPGLAAGTTTTTFRRWKRPQVKVGGVYRPFGLERALHVDAVGLVAAGDLTDDDARRAGEADLAALLRRLDDPAPHVEVWRVDFRLVDAPDPRLALAADAALDAATLAEIDRRLDRLDRASPVGPWTQATLAAIGEHPAVVSTTLAELLGRERFDLKDDIRKLKRLGLTESLRVGYRLSPRGRAYLRARHRTAWRD